MRPLPSKLCSLKPSVKRMTFAVSPHSGTLPTHFPEVKLQVFSPLPRYLWASVKVTEQTRFSETPSNSNTHLGTSRNVHTPALTAQSISQLQDVRNKTQRKSDLKIVGKSLLRILLVGLLVCFVSSHPFLCTLYVHFSLLHFNILASLFDISGTSCHFCVLAASLYTLGNHLFSTAFPEVKPQGFPSKNTSTKTPLC